jgi:hypothetical protein
MEPAKSPMASTPGNIYSVERQSTGILVSGGTIAEDETMPWNAKIIDEKRILLLSDDAAAQMLNAPAGMAKCTADIFKSFLIGLHQSKWSGVISIDTGYGIKRVWLSAGELAFAASNIIDDRLGEVIYREERITIDELTDSAAQVTKATKFGQVLLASGIFSNADLWNALKMQVLQIVRSLFMIDTIYFELDSVNQFAPTEIVFQESFESLIDDAFSYGCSFRSFVSRLRAESEIELLAPVADLHHRFASGSFLGDLISLIETHKNVESLLDASKLIDAYTIAALSTLVNHGVCRIHPDPDSEQRSSPLMAPLKTKFDSLAYVYNLVRKAFKDAGKDFPLIDYNSFVASLNPVGFPSLFLDSDGMIGRNCVSTVFSQCTSHERVAYFCNRIDATIQFLLQITSDVLDFKIAGGIRRDYRSVSA